MAEKVSATQATANFIDVETKDLNQVLQFSIGTEILVFSISVD